MNPYLDILNDRRRHGDCVLKRLGTLYFTRAAACVVLPALWLACHILSLEVWGHSPVESKSEPCNLPLMWDSAEWRDRGGYGKWAALAKPQTLFHVCLLISLLFVSQDVTPPHASFGYFHAFTPTCFPSPRFLYMTLDIDETVSVCALHTGCQQ